MYTLARLEETALSTWLRESGFAFFSSLTLHSLSLALVVGLNIAILLSLLLNQSESLSRLAPLVRFYPLHWGAVVLVFVSGVALLLAYPAKALTNWVFWMKLLCLSYGLLLSRQIQRGLAPVPGTAGPALGVAALATGPLSLSNKPALPPRWAMQLGLLLWFITVSAGRFLAYTHSILLAARYY